MAGPGIHGDQIRDETLVERRMAANFFQNIDAARLKFAASFFSASAAARAKFQDSYLTPAKLDRTYLDPFATPVVVRHGVEGILNTDETAATPVEINEVKTKSFPDASDVVEQKSIFVVPPFYDDASALTFHLIISSSVAGGAAFDVSVEYRINAGALQSGGTTSFAPDTTIDAQKEGDAILSINAANVSPGDRIVVKYKRLGVGDSNVGAMRVSEAIMKVEV